MDNPKHRPSQPPLNLCSLLQVMATGGLSFPKMGTDGTGHRLVQRLGHSMHPVYPALTPLKGSHPADGQLAGKQIPSSYMPAVMGGRAPWPMYLFST